MKSEKEGNNGVGSGGEERQKAQLSLG